MSIFTLSDTDFIIQEPFTEEEAQAYLDFYGCYDGKKPKKKDELFLPMLEQIAEWNGEKDGKKIYKEIVKRVGDSVKDIKKEYPDLVPKVIPEDLEDEDEQ